MPQPNTVPLKVPHLSGFDKSHFRLQTHKVGELAVLMVDEVMGNQPVSLSSLLSVSLPPLATDTYMHCEYKMEAFYVPFRLLYGGFEAFYCQSNYPIVNKYGGVLSSDIHDAKSCFPKVIVNFGFISDLDNNLDRYSDVLNYQDFESGSLLDQIGKHIPIVSSGSVVSRYVYDEPLNLMPLVAYHLIWQEFYRAPQVQKCCFARPTYFSNQSFDSANKYDYRLFAQLPYISIYSDEAQTGENNLFTLSTSAAGDYTNGAIPLVTLADNHSLFRSRQRNFGYDYFTNAYASPEFNSFGGVSIDTSSGFTIASLRAGNSLQMFRERNNFSTSRYVDAIKQRTGYDLNSGMANRPVLLGSASYDIYSKQVFVTADNTSASNPFAGAAGGAAGSAFTNGQDKLIDGFVCGEPGYVFVIGSLVPRATYSMGTERILKRYITGSSGDITDMPNHLLQNVGNQPIYSYELSDTYATNDGSQHIFGYTDRYADFMTKNDTIVGLFRDGESLQAFAAQRTFDVGEDDDYPTIGSSFLEISPYFLDGVTAVNGWLSQYGCLVACKFNYKTSMPLYEYSIPSLQDPAYEHGETIKVHRGGFRL